VVYLRFPVAKKAESHKDTGIKNYFTDKVGVEGLNFEIILI
jgi:hypothetical protein